MAQDEMVGWHHQLNGHECEQTQGDSGGQRSLACCSSWGHRVGHDLVMVKNPPAMHETWIRSLGWEDPLEEGKATHSSILA